MVDPEMLNAATPVGAQTIAGTLHAGAFGFRAIISIQRRTIALMRCDLPVPPPPVTNIRGGRGREGSGSVTAIAQDGSAAFASIRKRVRRKAARYAISC